MEPHLLNSLVLVLAAGMFAQWLAWRARIPAILLLSIAGIFIGPLMGWVNPYKDFGPFLKPMIGFSVAVILFEGSLNLRFFELRKIGPLLARLLGLAIPLSALLGTLAAHYLGGLSWPVASVLGCLLVVTGPTVVIPLLRHAKLNRGIASILKWEGIINDPIGALLAVLVFEFLLFAEQGSSLLVIIPFLLLTLVVSGLVSWFVARLVRWLFARKYVPEYLKVPFVLSTVLLLFTLANKIQPEAGLMVATFLGVAMGNQRIPVIDELRRFKESISLLLLSMVFVLLTASLEVSLLAEIDWRGGLFLGAMLFLVRPAAVWLSTIKTKVSWQERIFIGWIAPRGVVAAAVAGLFGPELVDYGYVQGNQVLPLVFALIFLTVLFHGLSIKPLARAFGLRSDKGHGLLLIGASPWSIGLAKTLKDRDIPITMVDRHAYRLKPAQAFNIKVHVGEVLSEISEEELDFSRFNALLAISDNSAYDALVCTRFANELGRQNVFQVASDQTLDKGEQEYAESLRGRFAFSNEITFEALIRRFYQGWKFKVLQGDDELILASLETHDQNLPLLIIKANQDVHVLAHEEKPSLSSEDFLVVFSAS